MIHSRLAAGLALGLCFAHVTPSLAEDSPQGARDVPAAESLYEAGKQLLLDGRCELALERLQASQSLDPAIGTLLLIGHCQEKLGKTASAWAAFRSARSLAQTARQPDREQIADARARALEPRLAKLEIWLPRNIDTGSWSIVEDGRELPRTLIGVALPVDPGPRELYVEAPGYEPWTRRLVIADTGTTTRVQVPALVRLPSERPEPAPLALALAPTPAPPLAARDTPGGGHGLQRTLAYLGVGLGAAGLGVAATYGILARERFDDALDECPGGVCSDRGHRLRDSGDRHATIATVSAISGAVLVASGLGLWLAMPVDVPSEPPARARLGVTPVGSGGLGLELLGEF